MSKGGRPWLELLKVLALQRAGVTVRYPAVNVILPWVLDHEVAVPECESVALENWPEFISTTTCRQSIRFCEDTWIS
jgi:hypothetical protein